MSSHAYLISAILDEGRPAYLKLKAAGITPADLDSETAPALSFITIYFDQYNTVPTKGIFKETFGVELPSDPGTNMDFWVERVMKKKLTEQAFAAVQNFGVKARDDIYAGMECLEEAVKYYKTNKQGLCIQTPVDLVESVKQSYQEAKLGIMGVPTPWYRMDDWTSGWRPGNLCFVGARSGKGKTFFTILALRSAIKSQRVKKVFYVSGEMTPEIILQRYAVIDHKIAYERVRKGNLGPFQETEYLKYLDNTFTNLKQISILNIQKSKGGFSMGNLEQGLEILQPDLMVVDASYMLKLSKDYRNQFEIMGKVAEGLKELSLKYNVPTIATTQLNRQSLTKTSNDDSDFALSDQIAWNSDFMFILSQSDEQAQNKIMEIKPIKIREGARDKDTLKVRWCFDQMDFNDVDSNVVPFNQVRDDDPYRLL